MANPSFSTDPGALRPPLCAAAPLLWSLLPLIAGILLARTGSTPLMWMAAAAAFAVLVVPRHCRLRIRISALSLLAGIGLFLLQSSPPDPSWSRRPPREVRLILQIEETFNARKPGHISGIGKIHQTSLPVDTVHGYRTAFYLEGAAGGAALPVIGETIECRAVLSYLPATGELDDYQMYLWNRDIFLSLNRGHILGTTLPAGPVQQFRQRLYAASQDLLTSGCAGPGDPGNVLASMLLGNRSLLNDERIDLYRKTGTYHLFAVSGLHVGSVALCLFLLCRILRLPRVLHLLPVLAGTWGYVWLTGSSPSAVRAGIMISCLSLARLVFRQPHLFPALALSAWLVLVVDPAQLFHLGFQLSYGVVLSIILVGLPLARELRLHITERLGHPIHPTRLYRQLIKGLLGLADLACVSLSAALASMPLIVQHFELFTPGGAFIGILLNPLAMVCVMAGCITLLAGPVAGPLVAGTIAVCSWPAIRIIEWLLELCIRIPGAVSGRSWIWPPAGTCLLAAMLFTAWGLQRLRMRGVPLPGLACLVPHAMVLLALAMISINT
jgi:competence protein ComEC